VINIQYLGGKSKIAKWLCGAINPVRRGERVVWDAFCGGLSMSAELAKRGPVITSDANPALISLYQAVARGWDPPAIVTEEQYKAGKALPDSDPMKAFLGFGCSFGGKWFGGFARSKDPKDGRSKRGYASQARNGLLEDVAAIIGAGGIILHLNFMELDPADIEIAGDPDVRDLVLYLDPPYHDTTGYGATGKFDHPKFYDRVRQWAALTDVFVSEYAMPFGRPILEFTHDMSVAGGVQKDARRERLYHYGPTRPQEFQWATT
jgi:DNA adenine methylase